MLKHSLIQKKHFLLLHNNPSNILFIANKFYYHSFPITSLEDNNKENKKVSIPTNKKTFLAGSASKVNSLSSPPTNNLNNLSKLKTPPPLNFNNNTKQTNNATTTASSSLNNNEPTIRKEEENSVDDLESINLDQQKKEAITIKPEDYDKYDPDINPGQLHNVKQKLQDDFQKQFFNNMSKEEFEKAWDEAEIDPKAEKKKITWKQQLRWWVIDHERFRGNMQILINPTASMEEKHHAKEMIDELIEIYGEVRTRPSHRDKIPRRLAFAVVSIVLIISWILTLIKEHFERKNRVIEEEEEEKKKLEAKKAVQQRKTNTAAGTTQKQ